MKIIITHKCSIVIDKELIQLAEGTKIELGDYDSRLLIKASCAKPLDAAESVDKADTAPSSGPDAKAVNSTPEPSDDATTDESTGATEPKAVNPLMFKPLPTIGDGLSRLLTLEMGVTSEAALLKMCNDEPDKLIALRGLNAARVAELKAALDERAG